jgi:hypothetical protein
MKLLFSWDEIPEHDKGKLMEFLKRNYNIDCVDTAKIEKIDGGRTIRILTEKKSLSLKLNDDKTKVNLIIDDGRTDEFIAKTESSKLNIYDTNKTFTLKTSQDLGNHLIEIGEQLKCSPNEELEYIIRIEKRTKSRSFSEYEIPQNIGELATQIKNLSRSEAEIKLSNLKSKDLTELCKILSISTSGKRKKEDIINKILYSIFDSIEGHRFIRNFSRFPD